MAEEASVIDFTSSLYLGMRHESAALAPWSSLTTGVPAALRPPPGAISVANYLARLQGCAQATLAASTLHLFGDLFGLLAQEPIAIYVDADAYPIAQWATTYAAARGAPVQHFPHRDTATLQALVEARPARRPVVVADGLCVECGMVPPLAAYLQIIQPYDGLLVLDDTQALGLLGRDPGPKVPYGFGGGGVLQFSGLRSSAVILVCSLAKAFGVPLAVLSGSRQLVARFEATSPTRVHCSPPSIPHLRAAEHALELNRTVGDILRGRLAERVRFFRWQLRSVGLQATGGPLPNQSLPALPVATAMALHRDLLAAGVRTALLCGGSGTAQLRFILTARHQLEVIQQVVRILARLVQALAVSPAT
jgi:8-amino-7-oxononanoate synthase